MKILRSLIIFCLLQQVAIYCNASSTHRVWVLDDFSKGQNNQISPLKTPNNQAVEAVNVRFNSRYGSLAKRDPLLAAWDAGSSAITGLDRFYKSDGTIKAVMSTSTTLEIGNTTGTGTTTIASGLTDGKRWQFVTYKDLLIGGNGYDQPIKYDGHTTTTANTDGARTAGELCAELGAPFAELNTGSNLDASSWYQYKMAFYDGSTYDYSTAKSNPINTGSTVRDITLTGIPLGPTGTTARYIYRTLGAANQATVEADTTYYKIATISNNTGITINDAMTDATADDNAAPTWATVSGGTNVTPPMGSLFEIAKERLFVAGHKTYPSEIYWSDSLNPDHFLPSDYEVCRPDDGDKITFIKTFLGILHVGKTNTIQKFYTVGDSDSNWEWSDPFSFIGCPASYTVSISPTGVIYLARNGLYRFNGQSSSFISDAVTPTINDISQNNIEECFGIYNNNEYRLAYTSTESGSAHNNRVLLYDFVRDAYVIDYQNVSCFAVFRSGNDYGTLYAGSSAADGVVTAYSTSSPLISESKKSRLDTGAFNDSATTGTEIAPIISIAWNGTIDTWLAEMQAKNASITNFTSVGTYLPNATIARPDTTGAWTSPIYQINATNLTKLYWNENLGAYGDVVWQLHLNSTSATVPSTAWSSNFTDPSGSNISGVAGNNFVQLRCNMTTSDINYTPTLYAADGYVFKMTYSKEGTNYETSILSTYKTGWKDFDVPLYKKFIRRMKVFYEGTSGTVSINYKNDEGDIDKTFTIDLSVSPDYSNSDEYIGEDSLKIYTFYPPANSATDPSPIGQQFQFTITEDGVVNWLIHKIEVAYDVEELDF